RETAPRKPVDEPDLERVVELGRQEVRGDSSRRSGAETSRPVRPPIAGEQLLPARKANQQTEQGKQNGAHRQPEVGMQERPRLLGKLGDSQETDEAEHRSSSECQRLLQRGNRDHPSTVGLNSLARLPL